MFDAGVQSGINLGIQVFNGVSRTVGAGAAMGVSRTTAGFSAKRGATGAGIAGEALLAGYGLSMIGAVLKVTRRTGVIGVTRLDLGFEVIVPSEPPSIQA